MQKAFTKALYNNPLVCTYIFDYLIVSSVVNVFFVTKLSADRLILIRFSTNMGCNNETGFSPEQKHRHHVTEMACSTQFIYIFTLLCEPKRRLLETRFSPTQKLVRTERSWCCALTGYTTLSAFRRDTVQSTSVSGFFDDAVQSAVMDSFYVALQASVRLGRLDENAHIYTQLHSR